VVVQLKIKSPCKSRGNSFSSNIKLTIQVSPYKWAYFILIHNTASSLLLSIGLSALGNLMLPLREQGFLFNAIKEDELMRVCLDSRLSAGHRLSEMSTGLCELRKSVIIFRYGSCPCLCRQAGTALVNAQQ
jgi:hypothetical protein